MNGEGILEQLREVRARLVRIQVASNHSLFTWTQLDDSQEGLLIVDELIADIKKLINNK